MTIAPVGLTASLPTLAELHDSTQPAPSPWVRLDTQPRWVELPLSQQPCRCDPGSLALCSPCAMRDEIAWKRREAAA